MRTHAGAIFTRLGKAVGADGDETGVCDLDLAMELNEEFGLAAVLRAEAAAAEDEYHGMQNAAKRLTNRHHVQSGEMYEVGRWSLWPRRAVIQLAGSTNANTSLDGRQGGSEFFSQQTQTCSAELVGIRNVRPQCR